MEESYCVCGTEPNPVIDQQPSTKDTEASPVIDKTAPAEELAQVCKTCKKKFRGFRKLATELRLMIWKMVSNQTRNIPISYQEIGVLLGLDYADANNSTGSYKELVYLVANQPPAVLQVCRESREEGLKHYTYTNEFQKRHSWPVAPVHINYSPKPIYFNWKTDRLCVIDTPAFFGDDPVFMYNLKFSIQDRGLRFIALNTASWKQDNKNVMMDFIAWGDIPVEEVLLFHADSHFMYQEVLVEKRAVLELPITSDRSAYRSLLGNGEYGDKNTNNRMAMEHFVDLLSAEIKLGKGFKEHEHEMAFSNDEELVRQRSSWIRPKVDWCTVELKYPSEEAAETDEE